MLAIGSEALAAHGMLPEGRIVKDSDFICTFTEFQRFCQIEKQYIQRCVPLSAKTFHVVTDYSGSLWNYEFEIAWPGSSAEALLARNTTGVATLEECLMLKESHKYLKDSVHFNKTMDDIHYLRGLVPNGLSDDLKAILKQREEETYVYAHPNLNQGKDTFFEKDGGVRYVYDHDDLHLTVALMAEEHPMGLDYYPTPAYTFYMQDGAQVMTDKQKFFSLPEEIRLYGVYEESCVLALERSQIPFDFKPDPRFSFEKALMKVCTSITSGWFREFAWENYYKVLDLYVEMGENDYIKRFKQNQRLLKPFQ